MCGQQYQGAMDEETDGNTADCTWRKGYIAPIRGDTEVLDHLDKMG